MSDEEDLDLQALQRQLDDAFKTTRPRPAFEDELWLRMQSRRPIWLRLRDGLTGLIDGVREAPAVPSAAVAIALVVLVGAGLIRMNLLHPGGASSIAGAPAGQPGFNAAAPDTNALPAPARLSQPPTSGTSASGAPFVPASPNPIYLGPATLTWSGHLDATPTTLPVFRYQEPSRADADRFAESVGASPSVHAAQGALGMYAGKNFTLVVTGSIAQPAKEPTFSLSEEKPGSTASGSDPVAIATAYLAGHHLIPSWPYETDVQTSGTIVRVRFLRSLDLKAQGQANLVDGLGERYGTEVDIATDTGAAFESGPLPLALPSVDYAIISADQAVRAAISTSAPAGTHSAPVVQLTKAELVYVDVFAGDHSFYEPAFLFSGTFTDHGVTYVKRVLVPAVSPAFLSP